MLSFFRYVSSFLPPLNMILYFLTFPQAYHLYLFPLLFGLFSLLRTLVCYIYLCFLLFRPFQGHYVPTVYALLTHYTSTDDWLLDDLGYVLYFQVQDKSIGPSGLDVSQVVVEAFRSTPVADLFCAAVQTNRSNICGILSGPPTQDSHEHLGYSLLFPRIFLALVLLKVSYLFSPIPLIR